jgi:hypothetical protein
MKECQYTTAPTSKAADVQVFCLLFARRRWNDYFYSKQKRETVVDQLISFFWYR